ncbi:MAG: P27 family phage terminase small subunit [Planctomycetes bacterium]|nr:P27 family phage terminase small subunit [Planctomycetota bacterium]
MPTLAWACGAEDHSMPPTSMATRKPTRNTSVSRRVAMAPGDMYPLKDAAGTVKYWQQWQQWPQVSIAHRLSQQLTKLEAEFGLTPASRSRISVQDTRPAYDADEARFFGSCAQVYTWRAAPNYP